MLCCQTEVSWWEVPAPELRLNGRGEENKSVCLRLSDPHSKDTPQTQPSNPAPPSRKTWSVIPSECIIPDQHSTWQGNMLEYILPNKNSSFCFGGKPSRIFYRSLAVPGVKFANHWRTSWIISVFLDGLSVLFMLYWLHALACNL